MKGKGENGRQNTLVLFNVLEGKGEKEMSSNCRIIKERVAGD